MSRPDADPVSLGDIAVDAVEIVARRGREVALRAALASGLALDPPPPGRWRSVAGLTLLAVAPDRWLLLGAPGPDGALAEQARRWASGHAAIVDIGHGQSVFTVAGRHAAAALARLCRLDLHPAVFGMDAAARTLMAQTPVTIWRMDADAGAGEDAFALAVPLTLAHSFHHALVTACVTFGAAIAPSGHRPP